MCVCTKNIVVLLAMTLLVGGCGQKEAKESATQEAPASAPEAPGSPATEDTLAVAPAAMPDVATEVETAPAVVQPVSNPFESSRAGAGDGDFSLQLGSFLNDEYLAERVELIRGLGYSPVVEVASVAGQTYHRVFLRGLSDRDEAVRIGEELVSRLAITYLIRQK